MCQFGHCTGLTPDVLQIQELCQKERDAVQDAYWSCWCIFFRLISSLFSFNLLNAYHWPPGAEILCPSSSTLGWTHGWHNTFATSYSPSQGSSCERPDVSWQSCACRGLVRLWGEATKPMSRWSTGKSWKIAMRSFFPCFFRRNRRDTHVPQTGFLSIRQEAPAFPILELADEAFGGIKVQLNDRQQLSWLDGHGSRRCNRLVCCSWWGGKD